MRMAGIIESIGFNNFQENLDGKGVVIGNSSPDTWDIRQTPVGKMPGLYVIGNAVNTIISGIQPVPTHWWINLLAEAAVIFLAAFIFTRVSTFFGQLATSAIFLIIAIPVSLFIFYRWGLFFNFVMPLFVMSPIRKIFKLLNWGNAKR
jgi:CHASE2 domain-containing sensor protein